MHLLAGVIIAVISLIVMSACAKTPGKDFQQAKTAGKESFEGKRRIPSIKTDNLSADISQIRKDNIEEINLAVYYSDLGTHVFRYHNINGLAVAEGDIILGNFDEVKARQEAFQRALASPAFALAVPPGLGNRWTSGVVYYRFADGFGGEDAEEEAREAVNQAIAEYETRTPLDFQYRTDQQNYIEFVNQIPCCGFASMSPIGMVGGRQEIKIQTRDSEDYSQPKDPALIEISALHEIGHSLGFKHEISRPDRDETILWLLISNAPISGTTSQEIIRL